MPHGSAVVQLCPLYLVLWTKTTSTPYYGVHLAFLQLKSLSLSSGNSADLQNILLYRLLLVSTFFVARHTILLS